MEARECAKNNPKLMVDICENLLSEPQLESAIRVGDCLAMLVEYFYDSGDMKRSYKYMRDMQDRRILLHPYIDEEVINSVHKSLGIPVPGEADNENEPVDNDDDVVDDIDEVSGIAM